jgi:NADP-dependent 3-hydroxy acid dehydrogenase YdfG
MNHLRDKIIVITGASSGIGAATAKTLAAHGAKLVLGARNEARLSELVAEIHKAGGTATSRVTDVTSAADMEQLAAYAIETFGGLDILVNNAGLMLFSAWKDLAVDDWGRMIDTNIRGYLHGIQAVLPSMLDQKSGYILNMASVAGHQIGESAGVYSATKFFVHAITESMRKELGVHHGIRSSTISPGVIDTGWADKVDDPAGREAARELNSLAITPQAVADAVVYALNQPADTTVNDLIISPTRQNW